MKKITRVLSSLITLVLILTAFSMFGCKKYDTVLKVYNCYDYIDESLISAFETNYKAETGKSIKVEYSCFDTPEVAYNGLKMDGTAYDLVCPSDYMIEKMAREGMLQKFSLETDGNYMTNVSPYIKSVFESISWGDGENLAQYAAGYMWGTLGLVYNAAEVPDSDMETWLTLWSSAYSQKFTIKNSVRDTYFIGLAKYFENELAQAKATYEDDGDFNTYQNALKGYFNATDAATVSAVKDILISLGNNCKGLEVDSGKEDIIKGAIDVYFAWSGDAVYAIGEAEENNVTLKYYVPNEGSNVWFDGWVIPKASTKTEEAKAFIEFLSKPENVIKNMDYIGYVSVIAGEEIFDYVCENYDEDEGEEIDLCYFFGDGDFKVTSSENRGISILSDCTSPYASGS